MTSTSQPISRLSSSMIPMLCNVALLTVASPMIQGSRIATGDTAPDLPTCHTTSSSFVTTPSFLSLIANEPLG
jgi:hypothetical protein